MRLLLLLLGIFIASWQPANAVQPDEILSDPKLEARARALSSELRCLVCQNQSIDDSDAPLARDLRLLIRDRLKAGDSDREVLSFLVDRYGEFVLLKPSFTVRTLLLWLGPFLMLALGLWAIMRIRTLPRDPVPPEEASLTEDERKQLEAMDRQ